MSRPTPGSHPIIRHTQYILLNNVKLWSGSHGENMVSLTRTFTVYQRGFYFHLLVNFFPPDLFPPLVKFTKKKTVENKKVFHNCSTQTRKSYSNVPVKLKLFKPTIIYILFYIIISGSQNIQQNLKNIFRW